MGTSNNRNRKRASQLRKIVRIRDNFTCQNSKCTDPAPGPVQGACYQTNPDNPNIINICSFQINDIDPKTDKFKGYRKTNCPLQVHHIIPYFKLKLRSLSLEQEAECCTLLCESCHSSHHTSNLKTKKLSRR